MKNVYPRQTFLSLIFLLISQIVFSQSKEEQIEVELKSPKSGVSVFTIGVEGTIIGYSSGSTRKENNYRMLKVTTEMKVKKDVSISLPVGFGIVSSFVDSDFTYLLFTNLPQYRIYKVKNSDLSNSFFEGHFPGKRVAAYNFRKNTEGIYIGGVSDVGRRVPGALWCYSAFFCMIPALLIYQKPDAKLFYITVDMDSKPFKKKELVIDNYKKLYPVVYDFAVADSMDYSCQLIGINDKSNNKNQFNLLRGVNKGKAEGEVRIKLADSKSISTAKVTVLDKDRKILVGLYKNTESYKKRSKKETNTSAGGFFITFVEGSKQVFSKTIPFNSFKNFKFDFGLKNNKSKNKESRVNARANAFQSQIGVLFHEVALRDNDILVMAEPYYPVYHTETQVTVDLATGRRSTKTVVVFDGYQFMGPLLMSFDLEGNLLWENGFSVRPPLTFYLSPKFNLTETDLNEFIIMYSKRGHLYSRGLSQSSVGEEVELTKIKAGEGAEYDDDEDDDGKDKKSKKKNKKDKDTEVTVEGINYWYDNYYVTYGSRKTKGAVLKKDSRKTYYYLKKVEIE